MSPIFEYSCPLCSHIKEKIQTHLNEPECDNCGTRMRRIPSKTGYRRDHTVTDKE